MFGNIEKQAKAKYMEYIDGANNVKEMARRMKKLGIKGSSPLSLTRTTSNALGVNDSVNNKIIKSKFRPPDKMPSKLRMSINDIKPQFDNYDYPTKMLSKDPIHRMQEMNYTMGRTTGSNIFKTFNKSDKKLKESLSKSYKDRQKEVYGKLNGTNRESKFIKRNFDELRNNVQDGTPFKKLEQTERRIKNRKKIKRLPLSYRLLKREAV